MQPDSYTRRSFLSIASSLTLLPTIIKPTAPTVLRMGVIADLHHGLATDALNRLDKFMQVVDRKKPDVLLQLGDFNFGNAGANECMRLWQQFEGPRYHVLGNHDMDFESKQHMVDYWQMPGAYYSFDRAGFHFVVLDRNSLKTPDGFVPYDKANFYVDASMRGFADPAQLEWLDADLKATDKPTVVFVHQGLGMGARSANAQHAAGPIEQVLAKHRASNGSSKVVACFCGHHHLDRHRIQDGIHYVWINSASYYWVGADYGRMAYYQDPLFAFLTFHEDGSITLEGGSTHWRHPSPLALQFPRAGELSTYIANRALN